MKSLTFLKISLAILLNLFLLNPVAAETRNTKPNEPGPWPSIQVNTFSGNLFYQRTDLVIPTRGEIPLEIKFSYNSLKHNIDEGYGKGWSFSLGLHYTYAEGFFTVFREEGEEDIFTWDGTMFIPSPGVYDALTEYESGKYLLRTKYGMKYYFEDDSHKRLTKITDRNNNTITLSYTVGKPTTITDPSGRMLNLSWVGDHLSLLTDPNTSPNRVIAFTYDGSWNMTQVTRPLGNTWLYGYDVNDNLISLADPRSNTVTISYDVNEAVAGLSCTPVSYNKTFIYNNCDNTTTVTQVVSSVNRQTIYTFDLSGKVTGIQYPGGGSVNYTWDSQNNIASYTNENGSTTTYAYDSKANLLSETDCLGGTVFHTYENIFNKITGSQDKRGYLTTYAYDANGNLVSVTDCFNNADIYTYNSYGEIISAKDKNNKTTTYSYDIYGNQTGLTDPLSFSDTRTYDLIGNMLTFTDKRGYTTTYAYDALDRNTLITDAMANTRTFNFDANSNLISETNQNSQNTNYAYDVLNKLTVKTNAIGGTFVRVYDEAGNVISETNEKGNNTYYTYNLRDWLTGVTDCLGNTETHAYNAAGDMLSATDKGGNTTTFTYNCLGLRISMIDPGGYTENYAFDTDGNMTGYTNKNGIPTTYVFDGLNRMTNIYYAMGYNESFAFDPVGNKTGFTDKNGNTTLYTVDALGRVIARTDPLSKTELLAYDGVGYLTSFTDKNGNTSTYTYDILGRLSVKTDPPLLSYTESYTYDGVGNALTHIDKRGNTTAWQYDNLNRKTSMITPMGFTETFVYDAVGNLTSFTNKNGLTTSYAYNCLDQLTSTIDPLIHSETYTYNAVGNMTGLTDKNGGTTTWNYSCCRLLSATDQLFYTENYGYDNYGNRTSITNKNNFTTTYSFDNLNRLYNITTPMSNQTQYILDGNGNVLTENDANNNTITYAYNTRGELISMQYPDATSTIFNYDNNGDLLQSINTAGIGDILTYSYDVVGRVTSKAINYGSFSKTITYTYDQNGNNLTVTSETGTITYQYDIDNRVSQITDQNGGITTFVYDGMGNQTAVNYPNAVSTFTTYDAIGNIISVVTQTTPAPPPPPPANSGIKEANANNRDLILYINDLAVTAIISPVSGWELEMQPVTIEITNFGLEPVFQFEASYFCNGIGFSQFMPDMIINPGQSVAFTFIQLVDLSGPGDYLLETCAHLIGGDENPGNDCLSKIITNYGEIYQSYFYGYDNNGNKISEFQEHTGTSINCTYSGRNLLLSEFNTTTGFLNQFTYTPAEQRQTMSVNGIIDYYSWNPDGALLSAGATFFTNDNNGCRTSEINADGLTEFTYGFDKELLGVFTPTGSAQYDYSGLGFMLFKVENGVSSYLLPAGGELLQEMDLTGTPTVIFNSDISITQGLITGYNYYDGESATLQLDPAAGFLASADYDEHGVITSSSGAWVNNRIAFQDMVYNPVTDLYSLKNDQGIDVEGYDPYTGVLLDGGTLKSVPCEQVNEDKKVDKPKPPDPKPEEPVYCKGEEKFTVTDSLVGQAKGDRQLESDMETGLRDQITNKCKELNCENMPCDSKKFKNGETCQLIIKTDNKPSIRQVNRTGKKQEWTNKGTKEIPIVYPVTIMTIKASCKCVCLKPKKGDKK